MRVALALVAAVAALFFFPASAPAATCQSTVNFQFAGVSCNIPGTDAQTMVRNGSTEHHQYSFEPKCTNAAQTCEETPTCDVDEAGTQGEDMIMYQDGRPIGETCWTEPTTTTRQPTPEDVMRAARRLGWPSATLVIQPPGGETLVNFATNFYSTTTRPTTRTVHLIDTAVTIEATPATYTWRFGDGHSRTSHGAGGAYPDLQITHRYRRTGAVTPQVDLTYTGRYRLDDGPWQQLPDTLTVAGTPQTLRVLTATPHLVG